MRKIALGQYVKQIEGHKSFTLFDFPPKAGFDFSMELYKKNEEAMRLVGKLDGITKLLPDKDFFIYMFVKKDATYSSQIEGTQATFQDAVVAVSVESNLKKDSDVDDILHYIEAVNYGAKRIKELPLSLRFICEIHEKLMRGARQTQHAYPGEFRKTQNWIGAPTLKDATFVPPHQSDILRNLTDLEKFIHSEDSYPKLLKAGLLHSQFETIHPFTDGNGRTGRILITLYFHFSKLLDLPVLYLSSYFKKYQKYYYENLSKYHDTGDYEAWLNFYLDAVIEMANSSIEACDKIIEIRERDMLKISTLNAKTSKTVLIVLKNLYKQPIVGIAEIIGWTGFSRSAAYKMIERLIEMQILINLGDQKYGQKYIYQDYYKIFDDSEKTLGV